MARRVTGALVVAVLVLAGSGALCAADVDLKGVTPGKWTMDLDAARKLASRKKLPILLNFSGSDWCGWCTVMEKNVFSKQEWKDYARDNILMVILDFPRDKSGIPEDYVERNDALQDEFEIKGFPTFIVVDDDGETVLGRLGAGQNKTPESFKQEVAVLVRYRAAQVAEYVKTLKGGAGIEYRKIIDQMEECRKIIKDEKRRIEAARKKVEELQEKIEGLEDTAAEFRAAQSGPDGLKTYKQLKKELDAAEKKLADWIRSAPPRTMENARKFQTMNAQVQELRGKLSKY